jgi:hypothetical protein
MDLTTLRKGLPVLSYDWRHVGDVVRVLNDRIDIATNARVRSIKPQAIVDVAPGYALLICNAERVPEYEVHESAGEAAAAGQ